MTLFLVCTELARHLGMIEIHPLCKKIIRLPEFQRLHDLKQLECLYYIYPGATHDRYAIMSLLRILVSSIASASTTWQKCL